MSRQEDGQLLCYNKGCGKKYLPLENNEKACRFHPGVPVFHDAYKGWGCCQKKVTDFTEFLNIPGCTWSYHSNEKPKVEEKVDKSNDVYENEEISVKAKEPVAAPLAAPIERPPIDTPLVNLPVTVAASLKSALERKMKELSIGSNISENGDSAESAVSIRIGTSCKNNSCTKSYEGEASSNDPCVYHPGVPIFHEGMKYWSCCQRKTSEFDHFLKQEGCETGAHVWSKKDDEEKTNKSSCRYDWHQTGSHVIITVYSKMPDPNLTLIQANPVLLHIYIRFDGKKLFDHKITLQQVIDIEKSAVNMSASKVEIKLQKAQPGLWSRLEHVS